VSSSAPVTAAAIDALLPQTQCTRCGYEGCAPYAAAVASGQAAINRCPPGGAATIEALATLLQRAVLPLDPACGAESAPTVAWIDAERCIGCARCLPPCPVDAIIGAQRLLHTVINSWCTGCELCLADCPVDCIEMRPRIAAADSMAPIAGDNSLRYAAHQQRHVEQQQARAALLAERKRAAQSSLP
jgi:electron transport complex protein RnfB